ncbi:conserved hypothetical protein [delta proteobacterium NaphS2]|nr:conserved hypothetical protein [delta proteobacterium NaphS2]
MILSGCRNPLLLLLGIFLLTACASLPRMKAIGNAEVSKAVSFCSDAFPQGKWQLTHAIMATLPNGGEAQLLGITEISSDPEQIHAVMMTIEGLVLFDGLEDGRLTIKRGVAPFDSRTFAKGLMEDIRLIFIKPAGKPIVGLTEDGFPVCRYRVLDNIVVDVVGSHGRLEILKYENERLIRRVTRESNPLPEKITLTAYGPAPYGLNLRLISAEQIKN